MISDKLKKVKQPELSILDLVKNDPRYTSARSVDWFKKKISGLGGNSPSAKTDLLRTTKDKQSNIVLPGTLVMFSYDPKHKDTLPFYDKFPCALVIGLTETGWTGINFHYLPYVVRGKLFDKLNLIASKYKNDRQQILRMNWKLLGNVAKFPEVRPAVKQYLYSHVRSRIIKIDVEDWKTSLFLPVESFAKKSLAWVTRDSMQQVRKLM